MRASGSTDLEEHGPTSRLFARRLSGVPVEAFGPAAAVFESDFGFSGGDKVFEVAPQGAGQLADRIGERPLCDRLPPMRANVPIGDSVLPLLRNRGIRQAVLVSGIVMAAVDITLVYLPALGQEAGFTAAFLGWALAVRAAA